MKLINDMRTKIRQHKLTQWGVLFALGLAACTSSGRMVSDYQTPTLKIERLTKNTFTHISYLDLPDFGRVACNGLIYKNGREVIVFDTPTSDLAATDLLRWIREELHGKTKAIVVNHFHSDCLGTLETFHKDGIPSYANALTIKLAKENGDMVPQIGFQESDILAVGDEIVINRYFGEGHTKDNIVSYLPAEKVIFGGCLIKEVGAGKGNLADANMSEWSNTIRRIKEEYPHVKWIVPGHGKSGGIELLDYTIKLFEK